MNKQIKILRVIFLMLVALANTGVYAQVFYYVTSNTLNVREGDSKSAKVVYTLKKYDVVEYESGQPGDSPWSCVDFTKRDGSWGAGWVSDKYIVEIPTDAKIPVEKFNKEWRPLTSDDLITGTLKIKMNANGVGELSYKIYYDGKPKESDSIKVYYVYGRLTTDAEGWFGIAYDPKAGYLCQADLLWTTD